MDQHKEVEVEGEPTDRRKEEEKEDKPEEPADLREVEVEAVAEVGTSEEPTDQRKEEAAEEGKPAEEPADLRKEEAAEEGKPEEPTEQRKEGVEPEVGKPEEPTGHRKEGEVEEEKEKETERSSDEVSVFVHPCSLLLRYLVRAYAWCLGLADWFGGGTRPSASPAASTNSSREEAGEAADISTREISKTTTDKGFYMREVIMRVRAVRRGPRTPSNPREGRGGGGGSHN